MNKKDLLKFVPPATEKKPAAEASTFESEAYGTPQPAAGAEATVFKPVGSGAPVPIVAPKHNTIQLQPIIVPLAVVPYMTQDSDILRAESAPNGGAYGYNDFENAEFSKYASDSDAKAIKSQKKKGTAARVCALIIFVFAVLQLLTFLLGKWAPNALNLSFGNFNVIDAMVSWIRDKIVPTDKEIVILYTIAAGSSAILAITSLVSIIAGKYPHTSASILQLLSAAPVGAALIYILIKGTFVMSEDKSLIILTAITVAGFLLSVIFIFAVNKKRKYENFQIDERRASFESDSLI